MNRKVRLRPKAKSDLAEIWRYSREKWGKLKARSYVGWFEETLNLIDQHPGLAKDASSIEPQLLKYAAGSHIIYFRMTDDSITISRILHQSMDHEQHFDDE